MKENFQQISKASPLSVWTIINMDLLQKVFQQFSQKLDNSGITCTLSIPIGLEVCMELPLLWDQELVLQVQELGML